MLDSRRNVWLNTSMGNRLQPPSEVEAVVSIIKSLFIARGVDPKQITERKLSPEEEKIRIYNFLIRKGVPPHEAAKDAWGCAGNG